LCKALWRDPGFLSSAALSLSHVGTNVATEHKSDITFYPHSSAGFYYGTNTNVFKQIVRVEEIVVDA
jgi:hypothetical protein